MSNHFSAANLRFPGNDRRLDLTDVFAGLRSDPFFADVEGTLHGFQWTGHDDFAGNNVDSIALEVPSDVFGADPVIGVWATDLITTLPANP